MLIFIFIFCFVFLIGSLCYIGNAIVGLSLQLNKSLNELNDNLLLQNALFRLQVMALVEEAGFEIPDWMKNEDKVKEEPTNVINLFKEKNQKKDGDN